MEANEVRWGIGWIDKEKERAGSRACCNGLCVHEIEVMIASEANVSSSQSVLQ